MVSETAIDSAPTIDHPAEAAIIGYRTLLPLRSGDPVAIAERHVREWLAQKLGGVGALDSWDGASDHEFSSQFRLTVAHADDDSGRIRRRLYRLTDDNHNGLFEISLFAAAVTDRGGHVIVEGARSGVTRDDAVTGVGTPNIVRQILDDVEIHDGATRLTGLPRVIREDEVDDVIRAITDPDRRMSVIVASSVDPSADERWVEVVRQLTRNSVGVATVFAVRAGAVEELSRRLPDSHAVPRGTVRTFTPGVRLEDPADGVAHRFVGPATLERAIRGRRVVGALPSVHARGPRTRFLERAIPVEARRTIDLLARAERAKERAREVERRAFPPEAPSRIDTATEVVAVELELAPARVFESDDERTAPGDAVPQLGLLSKLRGLVRKWLGRDPETDDDIADLDRFVASRVAEVAVATEQIDEVLGENEKLRGDLGTLRDQLDERDFEVALQADEQRALAYENVTLKRRLREAQVYFVVDEAAKEWSPPADIAELVARITPGEGAHRVIDRVLFTGKEDIAAEVEKRDPYGKYAADLWDFVRVLHDYAEMRATEGFSGNVHMYLSDDNVNSFQCNPQRHAARESDSVIQNSSWRSERVHPVPTEVDPDGVVLMEAHFKPTHRDMFAPRMHYFDDTGNTGKIYVGYIGRHLSTTQSS